MDEQSLAAIHEAAIDYFERSGSIRRCREHADAPDADGVPGWLELAQLGWTGMLVPEASGGLGFPVAAAAQVLGAAGEHAAPEPLLAVAGLSALVLAELPQSGQTRSLLAGIAEGSACPALAWQESAGELSSAPLVCGCEPLQGAAGGVLLQGQKTMVLPGAAASGWLVPAREGDEVLLLWIPRGTAGVQESPLRLVDGSQAAALRFEQVRLAREAVLARGPCVQQALRRALALGQILAAAELNGCSKALLEMTLAYLRTRSQFGKPIGSFQVLQHRAVDMFIHLEVAKATLNEVLRAASEALATDLLEALASRAKARSCSAALLISRGAVQLHGAIGYTDECDVSLFYKRVLRLSAWLGNGTAHRRRYAALLPEAAAAKAAPPEWPAGFPHGAP